MNFDTWFYKQSKLLQMILIIIPFVGWIVELLVRISALLRKTNAVNIIGLLVMCFLGLVWIGLILDFICILTDKGLFLLDK